MKKIVLEIAEEELRGWIELIYRLTSAKSLQSGITVAKYSAADDATREIVDTVSVLYRAECDGTLFPPISLSKIYQNIRKGEDNAK